MKKRFVRSLQLSIEEGDFNLTTVSDIWIHAKPTYSLHTYIHRCTVSMYLSRHLDHYHVFTTLHDHMYVCTCTDRTTGRQDVLTDGKKDAAMTIHVTDIFTQ